MNLQRIFRKRVFLHRFNITVYPIGKRQNQRNANDADGTCKRGEQGARLFAAKVLKAERKGRQERHGRTPRPFFVGGRRFGRRIGRRIGPNAPVAQAHNARGIFVGKLRVMGNHNHKPVARHLFQKFHHLHAGLAVQRASRLICQKDIRVVHQCACNGHALHLPAGKLVWALVHMFAKAHLFQRFHSAAPSLGARHAGYRQRKFYIGEDALVRNQVITLKNETYRMVPVGVPVSVCITAGGNAIDYQIAAVVAVQPAYHIQQCCFARAAGPQNCHKFTVTKAQTHMVQRLLHQIARFVLFANILYLKHNFAVSCKNALCHEKPSAQKCAE